MTTTNINDTVGYVVVKLCGVEAGNHFFINNYLLMKTTICLMKS